MAPDDVAVKPNSRITPRHDEELPIALASAWSEYVRSRGILGGYEEPTTLKNPEGGEIIWRRLRRRFEVGSVSRFDQLGEWRGRYACAATALLVLVAGSLAMRIVNTVVAHLDSAEHSPFGAVDRHTQTDGSHHPRDRRRSPRGTARYTRSPTQTAALLPPPTPRPLHRRQRRTVR